MERFRKYKTYGEFFSAHRGEITLNYYLASAGLQVIRMAELVSGSRRQQVTIPLWEKLDEKKILDLGCGNAQQIDGDRPPYLAQLLAAQGATVYGIDIGEAPADTGGYTHIKRDLVDLVMNETLSQVEELKGVKFDIVNSSAFIGEGSAASPALQGTLEAKALTMQQFTEKLLEQLSQMVKENGYVLIEESRYQNKMVDGKLQLEPVEEESSN